MSARQIRDLRRPDRRTPVRVLVAKTYHFVERVWVAYLARNVAILEYVFNIV